MAAIDDTVNEGYPAIDEALIIKLKELFPDRCPTIDMTDREIWLYSGQVKLVKILESVYIEQNNLQN
tara:strand:- start:4270 stop:4470 length:201 start_codon:yes stop_codon:yes gene_type:complete